MKLENRYTVLKDIDIEKYLTQTQRAELVVLCEAINFRRGCEGRFELSCIIIEKDWPEYQPTLDLLSERVDRETGPKVIKPDYPSEYDNLSEEITETEWRDIYYVYRAMHDGVCPSCGYHSDGEDFEVVDGLSCPKVECGFTMKRREIATITARSSQILKRRLESFNKVRKQL